MIPHAQFQLVVVPPAEPRTKPKALNFGLTLARGDIVAVYDVEDTPDILQLRRAAVALSRFGTEVGCLQAKLSYGNATQNTITKWFTIEYAMWFSFFLPGLASLGAPIPLGGTSNHFRRGALRALGGWDPYNVTEDCDLGIRMFREHYQIKVLESTTLEEANSDFVNWVKQRSRWYKGYLQTFLIHLRSPGKTHQGDRPQGHVSPVRLRWWHADPRRSQPALLGLDHRVVHRAPRLLKEIIPAPVYYVSLLLWAFGNFLLWYLTVLTARHTRPRRSCARRYVRARLLGDDVRRRFQGDVATGGDPVLLGEDGSWTRLRPREAPRRPSRRSEERGSLRSRIIPARTSLLLDARIASHRRSPDGRLVRRA